MTRIQGDYTEARRRYLDGLINFKETGLWHMMPMFLAGIAELLAAQGEKERAVELSAFILSLNIKMQFDPTGRATRLLQHMEADLPPDGFAVAVERGKVRKLHETVNELVAELSQPDRDAAKSHRVSTGQTLLDPLTEREFEVLHLIAAGMSNREIAETLVIAIGTVKWYVSEICSKLQAQNRVQAIARARELNLLS